MSSQMNRIVLAIALLFVPLSAQAGEIGYPEISIFEDLEMVRLLHKRGGFRFLPKAVTTAARRFESVGPFRQQALNLYLWTRYQLGTDPERIAHLYSYDRPQRL